MQRIAIAFSEVIAIPNKFTYLQLTKKLTKPAIARFEVHITEFILIQNKREVGLVVHMSCIRDYS